MAKNKKPKFLEKETPELLNLLKAALDEDEVDIPRALKITEELISRQPGDEPTLSVDEALHQAADIMTEALNKVKEAYDTEVSSLEDGSDEDDGDEEEDETPPTKSKGKKGKKGKKDPEPEEDEDDEEDDGDDEDGEDYSDWSLKDLKKECRTRGIKVTKGMSKAEMVKALEADDQE